MNQSENLFAIAKIIVFSLITVFTLAGCSSPRSAKEQAMLDRMNAHSKKMERAIRAEYGIAPPADTSSFGEGMTIPGQKSSSYEKGLSDYIDSKATSTNRQTVTSPRTEEENVQWHRATKCSNDICKVIECRNETRECRLVRTFTPSEKPQKVTSE